MNILDRLYYSYKKLLLVESYAVAYRFLPSSEVPVGSREPEFSFLKPGYNYWCADPFPFYYRGEWYIFVEIYYLYHNKACLGYYKLSDPRRVHVVLEEPFHLSYPNVFIWGEEVYMIPETHNARELRLYRARKFPDCWELDSVMLRDIDLADTSLYFQDDLIMMETMEDVYSDAKVYRNRLYQLDMDNRTVQEIPTGRSQYIDRRPAGNFFRVGNEVYHALQNCDHCYGEYMHIAKVCDFSLDGLIEREVRLIKTGDLPIRTGLTLSCTHTLNRYDRLEVVDVMYHRFMLMKPIFQLYRLFVNRVMGLVRGWRQIIDAGR